MPYTLTIHTGGAAFRDDDDRDHKTAAAAELARILRRLADGLDSGRITPEDETRLYDVNGNNVGRAHTVAQDPAEVLDAIAAQLTGREWTGADIEQVAEKITATGRTIASPRNDVIRCEGCGRTTTDPDRWDPEADTGRVFCDTCWPTRND